MINGSPNNISDNKNESKNNSNHHDEGDQQEALDARIYFPPLLLIDAYPQTTTTTAEDNHNNIIQNNGTISGLHQACQLAVETKRPLHLTTSIVRLEETVVLRKQETLTIIGDYDESTTITTSTTSPNVTIQGDLHSLFVLNNFSQLTLRHIQLKHTLEPSLSNNGGDHRQVGAAVNLRKKSSLDMQDGSLHSTCGFCLWIVQKSRVTLRNCELHATLRSPLVCFGQPIVNLYHCQIVDAGVHGLCARGESQLQLEDCNICNSASRAIYAYAQASVTLTRTQISGTLRQDKAAIEVSAAMGGGSDDDTNNTTKNDQHNNAPIKASKKGKSGHLKVPPKSTLIMNDCKVYDNQGIGVLIRGDVDCKLVNMEWSNNGKGDFVETTALQDDNDEQDGESNQTTQNNQTGTTKSSSETDTPSSTLPTRLPPTTILGLKRDPSGSSSFRQGDWWCPKCYQNYYDNCQAISNPVIVMAGTGKCPSCGYEKNDNKDTVEKYQQEDYYNGLTIPEISGLNRGQAIPIRQSLISRYRVETSSVRHQWMFDGDDKGWIPYDETSNDLLEDAFQKKNVLLEGNHLAQQDEPTSDDHDHDDKDDDDDDDYVLEKAKRHAAGLLVTVSNGRYQVDLEKMEQINVESQMLRFVKRVPVPVHQSK
ncbi:unnamed protein product [Cylindrotheca closterium]|uniref:WWE domain-containing protein n=1 Tax=Cylindrotheca closterium TaxID=2856 RepID=A0AAD2CMN0_9STRA|nr:unnamed protein product [Cylindrotheca closterium]